MKYVVPVSGADILFRVNDSGLSQAKEVALATNSKVILEDGDYREIVFPYQRAIKIPPKEICVN